jgi:glycosyltransferase involved in cell wall biosynthesis
LPAERRSVYCIPGQDTMKNDNLKIAMIGPLNAPVGGTGVLFEALLEALEARPDVEVRAVSTASIRGGGIRAPLKLIGLIADVLRVGRWADVVTIHGSTTGLFINAPVSVITAKLFGKGSVIRNFGGRDYGEFPAWRRGLVHRSVKAADLYLVEPERLLEIGTTRGVDHIKLFPNCRAMPPLPTPPPDGPGPCRKFIYLGHIRRDKGIDLMIEAGERFGEEVSVDVYGPMRFDVDEKDFAGLERVHYRGVLDPAGVAPALTGYDALLLPTFYPGEGHPGVILEAYAAGLPVITSRWMGIPEVVPDGMGMLIEPRDAGALFEAMRTMVEDNTYYTQLRAGVRDGRMAFSQEKRTDEFVGYCRDIAATRGGDSAI